MAEAEGSQIQGQSGQLTQSLSQNKKHKRLGRAGMEIGLSGTVLVSARLGVQSPGQTAGRGKAGVWKEEELSGHTLGTKCESQMFYLLGIWGNSSGFSGL